MAYGRTHPLRRQHPSSGFRRNSPNGLAPQGGPLLIRRQSLLYLQQQQQINTLCRFICQSGAVTVALGAAAAAELAPAPAACGKSDGWVGWSAAGHSSAAVSGSEMWRRTLKNTTG